MKILIVNYSDRYGGASNATYRIYKSLQKRGINVYMYVKKKNYIDKNIYEQNKFIYVFTKIFEKLLKFFFHYKSDYFHSYNLISTDIKKIINKINPDLIQLHWIGQNTVAVNDFTFFNKPIIWRLSDMWPILSTEHYNNKERKQFIDKYVYSLKKKYFNDKIIYVSPSKWLKSKLNSSTITKKNKKFLIPNAINTNYWKPIKSYKKKKKLNVQNKIIITFGATFIDDKRKGFDYLLKSLKLINIDYQLNVFGMIYDKKYEKKIKTNKNIHYLGNITSDSDLRHIYSISSLVAIPSIIDNSPNILFEANACDVPTVCFDGTGTKDFIVHKKTGWISKNKDEVDFAKGIMWILKNKKKLKNNVRKNCIKNYSELSVSKMYINLYKKVINNKKKINRNY